MSYTLRGRLETRLAVALAPLLAAAALAGVLREWWPLELAGLMLAVGLALDLAVLHRLVPYQPGWAALPIGLLEFGIVLALALGLGVGAPLGAAVAFFWGSWLLAQALGHAVFPLAHVSYGDDGGELGRIGPLAAGAVLAVVALVGGVAWVTAPPTVHLEAGIHRGPIVLDRPQTLVGERGAVVEGGIVIRSDDVTVRDVTVVGGEVGIDVDEAEDVLLDRVTVVGARMDGISVRESTITIRDCVVTDLADEHTQAIDISFAMMLPTSVVEGCFVDGGWEGIAIQMAHVDVRDNLVRRTKLRAISLNEMSMGVVADNVVHDALGIAIFCGDYSHCEVERNRVFGTRADEDSGLASRTGYAIVAHYGSTATIRDNALAANDDGVAAFINSSIVRH